MNRIVLPTLFAMLAACAQEEAPAAPPPAATLTDNAFSFVVLGDAPYQQEDVVMLNEAVPKIVAGHYPFVIHVGDYKGGGQPCTEDHDADMVDLIASLSPIPVFYAPGDNEWTDCDRFDDPDTGKRYSDLKRLELVRALFFSETPVTPPEMRYRRQQEQPENAAWVYDGVRFITLNEVGTNNGRDWVVGDSLEDALAAVDARDAANLAWLADNLALAQKEEAKAFVIAMQSDMTDVKDKPEDVMCTDVAIDDNHPCDAHTDLRRAIHDAALAFTGPVILIHGDTAPFTLGQTFAGEEAPNLWRLNAAGDSGVGKTGLPYGVRDVTLVTIDPAAEPPVTAVGFLTGKKPKKK